MHANTCIALKHTVYAKLIQSFGDLDLGGKVEVGTEQCLATHAHSGRSGTHFANCSPSRSVDSMILKLLMLDKKSPTGWYGDLPCGCGLCGALMAE